MSTLGVGVLCLQLEWDVERPSHLDRQVPLLESAVAALWKHRLPAQADYWMAVERQCGSLADT